MKRLSGRIFLLVLVILVISLPAQAAHAGQSGSSSPVIDQNARGNVSAGLPDTNSPLYEGSLYATGAAGSASPPLPVQAVPGSMNAGGMQDSPPTTGTETQAGPVNTNTGSSRMPDTPAGSPGRSDPGTTARADTAGGTGSPPGTGGENAARTPDAQGPSRDPGRTTGMTSPWGAVGAGSASVSGNSHIPVPEDGRGPSPQRQQQGPPEQSGNYPCGPAQATPLPPASGQTRDESKEETAQRQRSKRTGFLSGIPGPIAADPASSPFSLPSLFPLNMLLIGGFRRISKKNVLEHEARHVIYQAITAAPGIDVKTLTGMTGINENTLRYHLDRLAATGKIHCFARPGVVRYFQNQGAYSQFDHGVFHYLWTDTPRAILWLLHQHPGLTRQHIADALMIAGPSVTRQMDNLIEDGIVENRSPGRSNHYYLTADAARTIDSVMSRAPVMVRNEAEAGPVSAQAG
jgi:hypothetical protein